MSAIWGDLHARAGGFRGPCLTVEPVEPPIGFHDIGCMLSGAKRRAGPNALSYFRGYVSGREDYALPARFLEEDVSPESLEGTIAACFGRRSSRFGFGAGLIVNGGLQWAEQGHRRLAPAVAEIARLLPGRTFTVDVTLFIGAYGVTPFGAHVDDASHRTILFNLGPGDKEIRIWPRAAVEAQFGTVRNVYDIGAIAAPADKYRIRPGRAFALPADEFHAALNDDLSTTAAIVIDLAEPGMLAERELAHLRAGLGGGDALQAELMCLRLHDLVAMGGKRIASNGRLRYPPPLRAIAFERIGRDWQIALEDECVPQVFSLATYDVWYSRGRHSYSKDVSGAVEQLIASRRLSVASFVDLAGRDGASLTGALRMLRFLATSGSVRIAP